MSSNILSEHMRSVRVCLYKGDIQTAQTDPQHYLQGIANLYFWKTITCGVLDLAPV
jgi:hypothetical protein